jgi:hypothetical protein
VSVVAHVDFGQPVNRIFWAAWSAGIGEMKMTFAAFLLPIGVKLPII